MEFESHAVQEARQGTWPLLPAERNWGAWGLTAVGLSAGVAAWSYMIGGYVASYLNAVMGTCAMIAGSLVGMYFVVLSTVPVSVRYGVDTITASRPQFGTRGMWFAIFAQYASVLGWNCLLLILLGKATGHVAVVAGWAVEGETSLINAMGSLTAITVSWLMLRRGATMVRNYSYIIALLVSVLGIWILVTLVHSKGVDAILAAKPKYASGDLLWDYMVGFEILVATVLSWWPYMGGIVRMVASARQAAWPAMLCMGLPTGVISLIGLYSALVTGDADPTAWLISFGGLKYGILGLLFLGIANIGTAVIGAYVASIGVKQIPYVQGKLSWNWITFLVFLPAAVIAVSIPKLFFDGIGTFMAFLGVFFAPIAGIQIADYFFLRKQRLSVLGLYDNSTNSPYYFLGGVNPAAVVGMLCGFATYVYLLHPVSYATHFPFQYLSASLPALVVAALAYFTLSKLFIVNSKLGDYGKRGVADSNSRR